MDRQLTILQSYLQGNPDPAPTLDSLRVLSRQYPWFAAPVAAMLRLYGNQLSPEEFEQLRRRLAVMMGGTDPAMRAAAGCDDCDFYPAADNKTDTDSALDTFFATYGKTTPEEEALLERLIFNPVPDYADLLAHEEGRDPVPVDDTIPDLKDLDARKVLHARPPMPPAEETEGPAKPDRPVQAPAQSPDDSLLSESLAKIFIKQGRYERAYEIISNLNLNYPEKSIYFADQLRFLRKIMLIKQKSK